MMWKSVLIMFVFSLFCGQSFAQDLTQTVKGSIFDRDTKEPLIGASIIVLDSDPLIGATAHLNGQFSLDRVPIGRQSFQVSYIGYETQTIAGVAVNSGKQVVLQVAMESSYILTDAIVITSATPKNEPLNSMATLSARQFSVEESERYAGGLSDPARLASSFAGVASPSISSNGISIRGNNPSGLQWRIEGVDIPSPNHFADLTIAGAGLLSALSNQVMDNSDFYTGAFPAEYGNASSGVFDIKLKSGNSDTRENTVQASVIGIDVAKEGPFKKGKRATYLANYRYSTLGLIGAFLPEDAGILKYQDLSMKINMPTGNSGTFSLWGIGALDGINTDPADSVDWVSVTDKDYSETKMHLFASGLSHKYAMDEKTFINTSLSVSGNGLSFKEDRLDDESNRLPRTSASNSTYRYTLQSSIDRRFGAKHTNNSGFYLSHLGYDLDVKESAAEGASLAPLVSGKGSANLLQVFSQSQIRASTKLAINVGVHSMYFGLNDDVTFEPRIAVKYKLTPRQDISFAYGMHSRLESLPVYFVSQNGQNPNKELKLMRSAHYGLSYNLMITDNLKLNIEPYYQYLRNVPVTSDSYVSTINTKNSLFFDEALTGAGTGRNYGIEYTFEQYMSKGIYFLVTGSRFNSKYTAADGMERNTRFNKNYVFNALLGKEWHVGKDKNNLLGANVRLNYLSGNRIESIDYAASMNRKEVVYGETSGNRAFSDQLEDTPIVSFSVSYRTNKPKYSSVWSLQVLNALGAKEYEKDFYNIKTNTIDTKHSSILVPNLSYRVDF